MVGRIYSLDARVKSATSFPISALCKADGASALLALRNLLSDLSEALADNWISVTDRTEGRPILGAGHRLCYEFLSHWSGMNDIAAKDLLFLMLLIGP